MNQYDGLPLGICSTCTFQLASSHNFRQQCIQSVEMLVAVKLSFADDKKAYDTEVRVRLVRWPMSDEETSNDFFSNKQYDGDETHYVDWKDEDENVEDDEPEQRVSSHLLIEPVSYADDDDDDAENEQKPAKKIIKRGRKPPTRRTYKIEVVEESSHGTALEIEMDGNEHHSHKDGDQMHTDGVGVSIKNEFEDVKVASTVAPVVAKKSPAGRKPRAHKAEPKQAKLPKMEQCEVCGFISRSLKTHMMTHTNEKRYECDFCGKKFALRSSMKNHLFAHVNIR